jgi:Nif-specific regulatory protein
MNADRGTIYLVDHGRGEVFSRAAHLPELDEIRLALGQGVAGYVAATGETVNVPTTSTDPRFYDRVDRQTGYRTESMLAVPIRDGTGRVLGVLQLLNKRSGPFDAEDEQLLRRLGEQAALAIEATTLYPELARPPASSKSGGGRASSRPPLSGQFNRIVGDSPALQKACRLTKKAARSEATVLLRGESGTGKDLFARAVAVNSARAEGPFIKVDCAALPETLIENELFGHERGAFTGADRKAPGQFEAARGGTIFLDEIGELPLAVQGKLLRVLQDREFLPLGAVRPVQADVRIVAATNRDLERLVAEKRFRQDLYFRIKVVEIELPPLRARGPRDIERLVRHFVASAARRHGRPEPTVSAAAFERIFAHRWPGNVRELEHCMESAVVIMDGTVIGPDDLAIADRSPSSWTARDGGPSSRAPAPPSAAPSNARGASPASRAPAAASEAGRTAADFGASTSRAASLPTKPPARTLTLLEVERAHIEAVLAQAKGNRTIAAKRLGIGRNTLGRKLKAFGLSG